MKRFIYPAGLILAVFVCGAAAQTEKKTFSGTIGESRVEMTLERTGDALSGTYYYQKVGKNLKLSGAIGRDGKFTLTETSPAGAKTGVFTGNWSRDEETDVTVLNGDWKSPDGAKTLAFYLTEQRVYFTLGARLAPKTYAESNKAKIFEIEAEYPELSGVAPAAAERFNRAAREMVMGEVAKFRKDFLGQTAEELKMARERGVGNTVEIGYQITYADERLISVWFGNSFYTGGAHPNSYSFTLNFDLRAARILKLADLFKPGSDYLSVLADFSTKKLMDDFGDDADADWIERGAGPEAKNYESWNITRKGINVTFDSYQVAPYVAGPQETIVPFKRLENDLRPDYAFLKQL